MRGEGRVFQRGSRWWIAYYAPLDGRSVEQREPGGKTEIEAPRLLRQRLREVAVHHIGLRPFQGPLQERVTVEELLQALEQEYRLQGRKSLPQLQVHLRHIRATFGMDRASAVTTERLRGYIEARQQDGAASAIINRELEGLQRAFDLAVEAGTMALAPKFPSLAEHNGRRGFLSGRSSKPS